MSSYDSNKYHSITGNGHQSDLDQDLLTQLRIISNVRPHDSISTNNVTKPYIRIQKPGMRTSFVRFYFSECRTNNLSYIQSLLQRVQDRYAYSSRLKEHDLCVRLAQETLGAVKGLLNLTETYEEDAQFKAAMDVAIETIENKLHLTSRQQYMPETNPVPDEEEEVSDD
jgi:hypothetical protein